MMDLLRSKAKELTKQFEQENIHCTFYMVSGDDYASEILEYAKESEADMVAVATSKNHSVDKILTSKTDKKLINHSSIPVLSVPVE
jgi:nucleotide-binding universal stress UspA family protein